MTNRIQGRLGQSRMGLAASTAILAAALAIVPLASQQAAAGSLGLGGHAGGNLGGLGGGLGSAGGTLSGGLAGGLSNDSANASASGNVDATIATPAVAADATANLASSDSLAIGPAAANVPVADTTALTGGLAAGEAGANGNFQLNAKAAAK